MGLFLEENFLDCLVKFLQRRESRPTIQELLECNNICSSHLNFSSHGSKYFLLI